MEQNLPHIPGLVPFTGHDFLLKVACSLDFSALVEFP
jgi:hypothetical protein